LQEKAITPKPCEKANFLILPDHSQTFHNEG